jgi:hypothetical protein
MLALLLPILALAPATACLAGDYSGSATEIAAGLELRPDGRFSYGLSYGALDEQAEGRWEANASAVTLIGDPVTPPQFSLASESAGRKDELRVLLDVPEGMERQYFDLLLIPAAGEPIQAQFRDEGVAIELGPRDRIVQAQLRLGVFDLLSEPFAIDGRNGRVLHFRFAPNDLGKAAFDRTLLPRDGANLLLDRHERHLRFRPVKGGCGK